MNRFVHSSDGHQNDDDSGIKVEDNFFFNHISKFFLKIDHGMLENQRTSDVEVLPTVKVNRASKSSHLTRLIKDSSLLNQHEKVHTFILLSAAFKHVYRFL